MENRQPATSRKWYVIVAKPRTEKQVSWRLTEAGIENLLPLQRRLRQWHDRKKWVEVPIFFSYIFVNIETTRRSKVFDVGGVLKYVSIGGKIAELREPEIERVRRLCSYTGGEVVIERHDTFAVGNEVEITEGHFAGLHGHYVQAGGRNRLRITITGLCCTATVDVSENEVRKVKG